MTNIFFGKTNDDAFLSVLTHLKENVKKRHTHHVFIVPDRMSVLCEKKIFDFLEIDSTCDIEVLTLSRLASKVVKDKKVIQKSTSCMILQKVLNNLQKEKPCRLRCFLRPADIDVAETIYGTISQFKSCKVKFDEVVVNGNGKLLEDKLSDLALLYKGYQEELKKRSLFDSMDRLEFMSELLTKNDFVKNSIFYVSNFDSFTFQGYEIIQGIASSCKEFNIGVSNSDNPVNDYIYNHDYVENLLKIFPNANVFYAMEKNQGQFKIIQDNMFAFNISPMLVEKNNIALFEGKDFEEELLHACGQIKCLIVNKGYSFKDFFLAVPNLSDRLSEVKRVLKKFDYSYYIDAQQEFKNSLLCRFVKLLFNALQDPSYINILSFAKNPLLDINYQMIESFEDYILKYNLESFHDISKSSVQSDVFYQDFASVRENLLSIFDMLKRLKDCKTYHEFVFATKDIFAKLNIEQKLINMSISFANNGNIKQAKLFEQYYSKFINILDSLEEVLGNEVCDLRAFDLTLMSGISSTKISTTPLSVDAIFVGDTSVSFFEDRKVGFVLCAVEGSFPISLVDCGLITDEEIKAVSERYKLEPSIADINNKERFKAFELLLKPKEKLFVSYNYKDGQKSQVFINLQKMFMVKQGSSFALNKVLTYQDLPFYVQNSSVQLATNNLTSKLRSVLNKECFLSEQDCTLFATLNKNNDGKYLSVFSFKNKQQIKKNIFFPKGTTSVSQIESFMTCPFLHFVQYGLGLKEKDEGVLTRLDVGNLMHSLAENLFKKATLPMGKEKITILSSKLFDEEIQKDSYASLSSNVMNAALIQNLKKEWMRLALVLDEQSKRSDFVPTFFEARIDDKSKIKSLKIKTNGQIISLVGKIDRVDIFKDYFRIIDYKTGNCDATIKELFFGKKIQLQAYLKVVKHALNLKPAGAYYLPVHSDFSEENKTALSLYCLRGLTLKDEDVVLASDKELKKGLLSSDIVEIKLKDEEGVVHNQYSKVVSNRELNSMGEYAYKLIEKACNDILKLDITPSPLCLDNDDGPCKNCLYKTLCRFDTSFGNVKRMVNKKVELSDFDKGGANA